MAVSMKFRVFQDAAPRTHVEVVPHHGNKAADQGNDLTKCTKIMEAKFTNMITLYLETITIQNFESLTSLTKLRKTWLGPSSA
jgi:hypothetical protein